MSLSQCKKAKTKAEKAFKKKQDVEGKKVIDEGVGLMKEKRFEEAVALFKKAEELCKNSNVQASKKVKVKQPPKDKQVKKEVQAVDESRSLLAPAQIYPKGDEKDVPNYSKNTQDMLDDFKAHAPEGLWRTRFPPEPNGYLHIGHGKAMNFNFNVARSHGGECYLRFDDTNPTAEKQEYIDSILSSVEWLGNKPTKITYSSDYFDQLFEFALQLIKEGRAFVCNQTQPEVKASRDFLKIFHQTRKEGTGKDIPAACVSPCRSRSVDDNMKMFKRMAIGYYDEGEVCLRMKGDLMSDIPSQWDMAAYRIMFHEHPHTKAKWCVYPTYDYTHCIVDSLEYISHSLCTSEFALRQHATGSYYWLLNALRIYKPVTWEYARCNIAYNVLSKRKLNALVTKGFVHGWDDPRLLTLDGLRRRGYTPAAVNQFCKDIGVTKSEGTIIPMAKLESCVRNELDASARRAFAVLDPLKVTLTNYDANKSEVVTAANHPKKPEMGTREMSFSKHLYIDQSDFKKEDVKGFFGLAPGKTVRLLQAYNITCERVECDNEGNVTEIFCSYNPDGKAKPSKGKIQWVDVATAVDAEFRLYSRLFTTAEPARMKKEGEPDYWLSFLNPDSLVTRGAKVEAMVGHFAKSAGSAFQLQRVGYFTVDKDSKEGACIMNRTVPLRESSDSKAMKN